MPTLKNTTGLRINLKKEHGKDTVHMYIGKKAFRGNATTFKQFKVCDWKDGMSDEEIYRAFFDKLEKQEFRTMDGKVLKRDKACRYFLAPVEEKPQQEEEAPKPEAPKPSVSENIGDEPIADPRKAGSLVGHEVECSDEYSFSNSRKGILQGLANNGKPFLVKVGDEQVATIFVRKPTKKMVPLRLTDPEVRKSLHDKWLYSVNGDLEFKVTTITKSMDGWKVNGNSAFLLLSKFTFEDGTPVGELI